MRPLPGELPGEYGKVRSFSFVKAIMRTSTTTTTIIFASLVLPGVVMDRSQATSGLVLLFVFDI